MTTTQSSQIPVRTASVLPKPFLKWAGGKTQLLAQFAPFFPKNFYRYHEPFVGSAAVYWQIFSLRQQGILHFHHAFLTDSNAELINCYLVIQSGVSELIEALARHRENHGKTYYYHVRALKVESLSPIERAARFIYLNKTCFNGLYRVNKAGQFNVPMGSYVNPRIFDPDELLNANFALQNVSPAVADFREVLDRATANDFIYFDPPYAPVSKTSSFTSYTAESFGEQMQRELASIYRELDRRGCKVMLSNSWVESILDLYQGFTCLELKASRAINSNALKRGKISELLVVNYDI